MSTTSNYATIQDLIGDAIKRGVNPASLLPNPPVGFILSEGSLEHIDGGDWNGPTFEGKGWKVTSHYNMADGVTFYVDGDGDNAIPASEAGRISEALAEVARLAA